MQYSVSARRLAVLALVAAIASSSLAAQESSRFVFRALAGPAVPLGPGEFQSNWHTGPNAAIAVGYRLSPNTELAVELERGRFGAPEPVRDPSDDPAELPLLPRRMTPLWAGWIDAAFGAADGRVRPRLHVGTGVVMFGAARTGLGLRAGAGLDVPLSSRLSASIGLSAVHALTADDNPNGGYSLGTSLTYLPIRLGLAWH